mmetsp:Transcript_24713/g.38477  ORF Transcript_24713/g.38477 Transcript_24713/m.38477 type:complete len:109 (+) Transcript_24713:202-528(+)
MRVDMRPKVFVRVMRVEMAFIGLSVFMIFAIPLYFLKFRHKIEVYQAKAEAKKKVEMKREAEKLQNQYMDNLQRRKEEGDSLTTAEKGALMDDFDMARKIKELEAQVA